VLAVRLGFACRPAPRVVGFQILLLPGRLSRLRSALALNRSAPTAPIAVASTQANVLFFLCVVISARRRPALKPKPRLVLFRPCICTARPPIAPPARPRKAVFLKYQLIWQPGRACAQTRMVAPCFFQLAQASKWIPADRRGPAIAKKEPRVCSSRRERCRRCSDMISSPWPRRKKKSSASTQISPFY